MQFQTKLMNHKSVFYYTQNISPFVKVTPLKIKGIVNFNEVSFFLTKRLCLFQSNAVGKLTIRVRMILEM